MDIEKYYAKRAREYENVYFRPERKNCIEESGKILKKYFENREVLEIACGTGFWTETISQVSTKITAVDINNEVLEVAKTKKYGCNVDFIQDDVYKLDKINGKYDSLFAGFWLSHVPKSKISNFIELIHSKLNNDAMIVFMDNLYVEGNSTPISRSDEEGNSYQIRKLNDNSEYEIIKNFFNEQKLKVLFEDCSKEIYIQELEYFWILKYYKGLQ